MKTCGNCGFRNMVYESVPIESIKCENCGAVLFKNDDKHLPITDGNIETRRKLLHDEMPWDFDN